MRTENRSINSFIINKQTDGDETTFNLISGNSNTSKDIDLSAIDMHSGQPLRLIINGEERSRHVLQPLETIQIKILNANPHGKIKVGIVQTGNSGGVSCNQRSMNGETVSVVTIK